MPDIIDTIDGALHDWETSDDAMRWVPEADRAGEPRPGDPAEAAEVFARMWESYRPRWHWFPILDEPEIPFEVGQRLAIRDVDGTEIVEIEIAEIRPTGDGSFTITPKRVEQ